MIFFNVLNIIPFLASYKINERCYTKGASGFLIIWGIY